MQTTKTDRPQYSVPATAPTLRLLYSAVSGLSDAPAQVLLPGTTSIGRYLAADGGIGLPSDECASRLHARVQVSVSDDDGRLVVAIVDEISKNGTFVNGHRVTTCLLGDGDVVRIGDSVLLLRHEMARQVDGPIKALVGRAPSMRRLRAQLAQAAPTGAIVLLLGESGTGKELAAQALHQLNQQGGRTGPFVALNAAAIPESLAESQLFGHVAGAFSGARTAHDGFFRAAQGGTLFLDEIGELPLPVQAKLLRILEDKAVMPVGATRSIACDVRLVAATHRDLKEAVEAGRFRGDLYARLATLPIELPPLRARREDVLPLLAHHWGGELPPLTARLAEALLLHPWPFNVRELANLAVYLKMCAAEIVVLDVPLVAARLGLLPNAATPAAVSSSGTPSAPARDQEQVFKPLPAPLAQPPIERHVLVRLMTEQRGVISRVARLVGRSRRQVRRWLEHYQININLPDTE